VAGAAIDVCAAVPSCRSSGSSSVFTHPRQQIQLGRARRRRRHLVTPRHQLRHQPPPQNPGPACHEHPHDHHSPDSRTCLCHPRRDSPAVCEIGAWPTADDRSHHGQQALPWTNPVGVRTRPGMIMHRLTDLLGSGAAGALDLTGADRGAQALAKPVTAQVGGRRGSLAPGDELTQMIWAAMGERRPATNAAAVRRCVHICSGRMFHPPPASAALAPISAGRRMSSPRQRRHAETANEAGRWDSRSTGRLRRRGIMPARRKIAVAARPRASGVETQVTLGGLTSCRAVSSLLCTNPDSPVRKECHELSA
jgi:hypothetical protein